MVGNQPHRPGLELVVVLARHDANYLPSKEGVHQTRGDSVPLFFPASSCEANSNGLLYALGLGWSFVGVLGLPWEIPISIGAMVDVGKIDPNTLIRLDITATDPPGTEVALSFVDVPVCAYPGQLNRACVAQRVTLFASSVGIYELGLRSAGFELARFPF